MTLVLLGTEAKDIPIKPAEVNFDKEGKTTVYSDSKGKVVKKITTQSAEYKWLYEDGTAYAGKAYKNIKGKLVKPFSKTTLIEKHELIDQADTKYFINQELTYLLVGAKLKERIKELHAEKKAVLFKYANSGFKVYKAIVQYDPELDKVLMRCYRGDLRKANLSEDEDLKEATESDDVDSLDMSELEV